MLPVTDERGIEIAIAVNLRAPDEAEVYLACCHGCHDIERASGPYRPCDIWSIAHGVKQFCRWLIADGAGLEESDAVGRMRAFGKSKSYQRQTHADKDIFAIVYLPGGADDHQFSRCVFHIRYTFPSIIQDEQDK